MPLAQKLSERKRSDNQIIIGKFVEFSPSDKYFWPREMKLVKKLAEFYGMEFLLWATPPNFKAKSLAVYLGDWGKKFLANQLLEFKKNVEASPVQKTIILEEAKFGDDAIIEKKPKTLQDFLKLYQ